jgi:hypothetical protein
MAEATAGAARRPQGARAAPRAAQAAPRQAQAAAPAAGLRYIGADCFDATRVKILVVGVAGVGKTSLLRTIPEGERVCTVSIEGGLLSVRDMILDGRVKGVAVGQFQELAAVADRLRGDWQDRFDWVFVDSLSEMAGKCFSLCHARFGENGFGKWESYYEALGRTVRRFLELPKFNIVFTSLMSSTGGERPVHCPDVDGEKMKTRLAGLFDELFFMEVDRSDRSQRRIFRTGHGPLPAKDRSGLLDPVEPAHLGHIRDKILRRPAPGGMNTTHGAEGA